MPSFRSQLMPLFSYVRDKSILYNVGSTGKMPRGKGTQCFMLISSIVRESVWKLVDYKGPHMLI